MPDYRIYTIDQNGATGRGSDARCRNDEEACELARRMLAGSAAGAEVWAGDRRVGRVSPASAADIAAHGKLWAKPGM